MNVYTALRTELAEDSLLGEQPPAAKAWLSEVTYTLQPNPLSDTICRALCIQSVHRAFKLLLAVCNQ